MMMTILMNMKTQKSNSVAKRSGGGEEIFQVRQREYTGHAVAFFRKVGNLTQGDVASRIPCSVDSIGRIERGEQDPTFQQICMIAAIIGVTPLDLCSPEWGFHEKTISGQIMEGFHSEFMPEMLHKGIKEGISLIRCGSHGKKDGTEVIEPVLEILRFCVCPRTKKEIREFCAYASDAYFRKEILYPLMKAGLLRRTVKSRPSSPEQQYTLAIEP